MLSAVLLSMKSNVVRVAFCQELCSYLHTQNRATVEAQQFDLLVRLMNCALQVSSLGEPVQVCNAGGGGAFTPPASTPGSLLGAL